MKQDKGRRPVWPDSTASKDQSRLQVSPLPCPGHFTCPGGGGTDFQLNEGEELTGGVQAAQALNFWSAARIFTRPSYGTTGHFAKVWNTPPPVSGRQT